MNRKGDGLKSVLIYICIFAVILVFVTLGRGGIGTNMQAEVYTYSSLMSQLKTGDIDSITLRKDADIFDSGTATVVRNDGKTYTVDIISVSQFVESISDKVANGDVELITEDTPKLMQIYPPCTIQFGTLQEPVQLELPLQQMFLLL